MIDVQFKVKYMDGTVKYLEELPKKLEESGISLNKDVAESIARKSRRILAPHQWRGNILDTRIQTREKEEGKIDVVAVGEAAFFHDGVRPHLVVPARHHVLKQWAMDKFGYGESDPRLYKPWVLPTQRDMREGMYFFDRAIDDELSKFDHNASKKIENAVK